MISHILDSPVLHAGPEAGAPDAALGGTAAYRRAAARPLAWTWLFCALIAASIPAAGQTDPLAGFHIYAGNTHSHTAYTWSHGEQLAKGNCSGILTYGLDPASGAYAWSGNAKVKEGCAGILVINGSQIPGPGTPVKPDWQKYQGPPSEHFRLAKANGYDFYAVTDHSQEAALQPRGTDEGWTAVKQQAAAASDSSFAGLAGFEYSENDGPGGKGHINVFNTAGILNALVPGVGLPQFYRWLATAKPNGDGAVVASFNHPGADSFGNWADRDPQVTEIITMIEVINTKNNVHYQAFLNALDHGWKVAPVYANDNHGFSGIASHASRTFLLAKDRSKAALLDAMKHRRIYASFDKNIRCGYTVNGAIMGSTLSAGGTYKFDIAVSDPDTANPKDKITKIDIVKDQGVVVQEYTPTPDHSIRWKPTIEDKTAKYFFVRVWTAGGGDGPQPKPNEPMAWLAPVWTGR